MRAFFFFLLVLIPFLGGCAASADRIDHQAQSLRAPTIPEAEDCLSRVETTYAPRYPRKALELRIQGWVVVDIELSSDGKILSRRIESENPPGVFGQSALDSVDRIIYSKAVDTQNCRSLYMFTVN